MMIFGDAVLLRIFLSNDDTEGRQPLYEAIVIAARRAERCRRREVRGSGRPGWLKAPAKLQRKNLFRPLMQIKECTHRSSYQLAQGRRARARSGSLRSRRFASLPHAGRP
jgi:hypothetical protein